MLDLGWQEFVMVGLVLILVVGPKDMPRVLKAFARTIGKVRSMAREFQSSMTEVANQDEFKDVKDALNDVRRGNTDALAEFEKVKENVNTSYVPGFSSEAQEIKDAADDLKSEANNAKAGVEQVASASTKPKAKKAAAKAPKKASAKKKTAKKSTKTAS